MRIQFPITYINFASNLSNNGFKDKNSVSNMLCRQLLFRGLSLAKAADEAIDLRVWPTQLILIDEADTAVHAASILLCNQFH